MASLLRLAQTTRQAQSMIQSIGASPIERDENTGGPTVKGEENDDIVTFTKIGFVAIIALIALGTSGLSFYWIESFLVDFSSVLTMIFAPLVLYQKRTLRKLGSFRSHHNKLRLAVGNVRHENERMDFTLHKLSIQTSKLQTVEQKLQVAAEKSGAQVDRLLSICKENAEIQIELRKQLQAEVLRQIMSVLLSVDSNRDFVLSAGELDRLVQRLQSLPDSVEFNEDNFRQLISNEPYSGSLGIADVCNIVRNFNRDLVDSEQAVFSFKKIKVLSD